MYYMCIVLVLLFYPVLGHRTPCNFGDSFQGLTEPYPPNRKLCHIGNAFKGLTELQRGIQLTLFPPFLQSKPSGKLSLSHVQLDPDCNITVKQMERWLRELKLDHLKLSDTQSPNTEDTKTPPKSIKITKGHHGHQSSRYRINVKMISTFNPSLLQFFQKINDWYVTNGYILSKIDETKTHFEYIPETDTLILYIHTQQPKISEKDPFKITFLQKGIKDGENPWKNDPGNFHNVTQAISIGDTQEKYYVAEGKADKKFLTDYLGFIPGKEFQWDPTKWSELKNSGLIKEGEILVYHNPNNSITVHLNLVEDQHRKIEPSRLIYEPSYEDCEDYPLDYVAYSYLRIIFIL